MSKMRENLSYQRIQQWIGERGEGRPLQKIYNYTS